MARIRTNSAKLTTKAAFSLSYNEEAKLKQIKAIMENAGIECGSLADTLRQVLEAAFRDGEELESYLKSRKEPNREFDPEKDGFNSKKFTNTFISGGRLIAGLAVNCQGFRILVRRGLEAKTESLAPESLQVCVYTPVRRDRKSTHKAKAEMRIDLKNIDHVSIVGAHTGQQVSYRSIPAEEMGDMHIIRLDMANADREE